MGSLLIGNSLSRSLFLLIINKPDGGKTLPTLHKKGKFMPNYDELMGYLKELCLEKADGTMFITTDQKHSVRFKLYDGHITSCNYRLKRDHDAIKLIKAVKSGRYKFFPGTSTPATPAMARRRDLYAALFGETAPSPNEANSTSAAGNNSMTVSQPLDSETVKKTVEAIAKELAHYIGPVARLICDEYINSTAQARTKDNLIAMAEAVATEIGDSAQEKQFTEAVLGGIRSAH